MRKSTFEKGVAQILFFTKIENLIICGFTALFRSGFYVDCS
jgi:hypothetical protein